MKGQNKKLPFLLLFAAAAGVFAPAAFAQFSWRLNADLNVRFASWVVPTGEKTERFIQVGEDTRFNNTAANSNPNPSDPITGSRGNYAYTSGSLDLFSYNRITSFRENELYLVFQYRSDAVMFHTSANLNNMVRATVTGNSGANSDQLAGSHSFVQGDGRSPNWADFLRYSFNEWYVRGNFAFLTAYIGNTDNRGRVRYFDNLNAGTLRSIQSAEGLGVNTPTAGADYQNGNQEINNILRTPRILPVAADGIYTPYSSTGIPYLMLTARIEQFSFPLFVQVAADPGDDSFLTNYTFPDYRKFSGALRVSGDRVFNRITFDAIYKFRGGDPNTRSDYDADYNIGGTLQPNGDGISAHSFGVFANILGVPKFGFALGYSGYVKVFEDNEDKVTGAKTTTSGPLFNGIDARVVYTGIKDTTITYHNNVSFANAGRSTADSVSVGVLGQALPYDADTYTYQGWFALYNALGVSYRVNEQLTLSAEAGNRYGIITTETTSSAGLATVKRSHLRVAGGGSASFQFNNNLQFQAGIGVLWVNDSYSNDAPGAEGVPATRSASGGTFEVGIPVRMRIIFRD